MGGNVARGDFVLIVLATNLSLLERAQGREFTHLPIPRKPMIKWTKRSIEEVKRT